MSRKRDYHCPRTKIARHFESQASVRSTTHRLDPWRSLWGGRRSRIGRTWRSYQWPAITPNRSVVAALDQEAWAGRRKPLRDLHGPQAALTSSHWAEMQRAPELRFSAMLGREPEVELVLD